MITPLFLFFLGMLLIFLEFYLPGMIMGISGGILILTSIVLFAMHTDSLLLLSSFIVFGAVSLFYLVKFAMWRIRTAKPGYSIYSADDQEGFQASSFDASAIGKEGIVVTDLKPGGHILVEGKRLQAISQSGYLAKGSKVVVIGGQEESLIVKHIKESTKV